MPDYREQTARPSAGQVGTPFLLARKDTAGDLSGGTDQQWAVPQMDSGGCLRTTNEGGKTTYWATSQFASDSTGTDIAIFVGVTTVTAKILKIIISTTATGAATGDVSIIRRSAANTAGTAVNASLGQSDTRDAAGAVTPQHYTAHPTSLGTAVGTIFGQRLVQQAAGTVPASLLIFDFQLFAGGRAGLRVKGTTDIIAVNVAAALAGSGNLWDITWVWTEEPTTA